MSNIWFTADTHFGHKNIIKYCDRPFSCVEEMNETIITKWNNQVKEYDTVYHLGDFFWTKKSIKDYLPRLNGLIRLIPGGHDWNFLDNICLLSNSKVDVWGGLIFLKIFNPHVFLCHFPLLSWEEQYHGSWHLHGHTHGKIDASPTKERLALDVGIDNHPEFRLFSYEEIKDIFNKVIGE